MTSKQERFCAEYLVDLNATQAAIRAGYSERTARSIAAENLAKPDIAARVAELKAARAERLEVTADDVIRGLHEEATDKANGSPGARVTAWTALGKHLGMFVERHEHSGPGGTPLAPVEVRVVNAPGAPLQPRADDGG